MEKIHLNRVWYLGEELAAGGFGRIYVATSDSGDDAVVKLIPKEPGADRELLFEDVSHFPNILPILDTGEWEDFWVIVMPRAEKSLREYLAGVDGPLPIDSAKNILTDMTTALSAIDGKVAHCDLKPEYILLYQGSWCLA